MDCCDFLILVGCPEPVLARRSNHIVFHISSPQKENGAVFCVLRSALCVCFQFADLDIPTYKSSAEQLQTSLNDVDLSDLTSQTVRKPRFFGANFVLKNEYFPRQARDNHGERAQKKRCVFVFCAPGWYAVGADGSGCLGYDGRHHGRAVAGNIHDTNQHSIA